MTDEERADAHRLWQEIGKEEAARPTPAQLLAFMQLCDEPAGLDLAARMLRSAEDAHNCWIADHGALLDELRWTQSKLAEVNAGLASEDSP